MKAKSAALLVCGALSFVHESILAAPLAENDWPCEIAAQPEVAATAYLTWKSASESAHSWRSDPGTAALIADVAPRSISVEEGAAKISAYIAQAQAPTGTGPLHALSPASLRRSISSAARSRSASAASAGVKPSWGNA